jgi:two-component system, sensor histidine kinase
MSARSLQSRVLVLAQGRDATLTAAMLREGSFEPEVSRTTESLAQEIEKGAALVIVAQEFLTAPSVGRLQEVISAQPAWSDLPVIVVAGGPEQTALLVPAFAPLGNVSVLQRPIALGTLLTTVQSALRARQRQYEIRDLLAELAAADRRKDEFLAMLAHELRNPLAPIRSATEVMRLWNLDDPEQRELVELVRRQVGHMARLLDDLLDVSRITRGKITLEKQTIDLVEIAENAARAATPIVEQKGHSFEFRRPMQPVMVEADPTRMQQVISNLLHNAAKYTNPGGKISLAVKRVGEQAVIQVCDNGVGIAPEVLPHIFELFTQDDRSLDRSAGGLGIGLTVVKSLVQFHGGTVEARSDGVDCGAEVLVRLPALAAMTTAPLAASPAPSRGVNHRKVLIVDDNVDGADTLARLVRAWGHTVKVAYDGFSALEMSGEFRPEICLLDIGLPGMDGYELARRLQSAAWFDGTRLFAVSGYGQASDRERSRQAGFDAHLVKPVDPALLREHLTMSETGPHTAS